MRALLVGAGGMGKGWAKNLHTNAGVELAGWIDVVPGAAQTAAETVGISIDYLGTNLHDGIRAVTPDFVVDVTPPEVHHEVTMTSLANGIPVLGEKPMATSMKLAAEMVRASEAAGKLYMVSQSRRYDPGLVSFDTLVKARLGSLGILNSDFYIGAHFGGFRDEMDHVLLLDMAIHTFDAARMVANADPVSVYAEEFNPSWSWYRGSPCANALFEMEGGLRYTYRGSWCAEGVHTSWDSDWRAAGSNGTATWTSNGRPSGEVVVAADGFHSEMEKVEGDLIDIPCGIAGSLAEFLDALKTGKTPQGECHDNIKSLAMVFAAVESAERGERVQIAEMVEA